MNSVTVMEHAQKVKQEVATHHIIWTISYGSYCMDHTVWLILYGSYCMVRTVWSIRNDGKTTVMITFKICHQDRCHQYPKIVTDNVTKIFIEII